MISEHQQKTLQGESEARKPNGSAERILEDSAVATRVVDDSKQKLCQPWKRSSERLISERKDASANDPQEQTGHEHSDNSDCDSDVAACSDVSSNSDIFHAEEWAEKSWVTDEDRELERIDHIKHQLRARPLLPPHPNNAHEDFTEVNSGIMLPMAHCAFAGCSWTSEWCTTKVDPDILIQQHVLAKHWDTCLLYTSPSPRDS